MSKTLDAAAIASFDAMVKHDYQNGAILRPRVRVKTGVVGSTHRFPKIGKGTATKRIPQTDVVPMNIAHDNETATLEDWNAPEYTDIFDQAAVNFSERQELATTIGMAMGRRDDQLILDALDAAATSLTVDTDTGGTGTGLNTAKVREAKRLMDAGGVTKGAENRTFVIHANGLSDLLGDSDANTVDKNAVKLLVDGEVSRWVGFTFLDMEDRDEGGLPTAAISGGGTLRTNYAFERMAVGLAIGIDIRTEVNYIPVKTSWLANGIFKAGAVGIDAAGIVEVETTES